MHAVDYTKRISDRITELEDEDTTLESRVEDLEAAPSILASYLEEDVTYNDTAALADTALSVNVAASGIYEIELVIQNTTAATNGSLKLDFGGTATITNFIGQWRSDAADDPLTAVSGRVTAAGADFTATAGPGSDNLVTFRGSVEINAAGTFLVRGAQDAADASDTTILRGSTLKLTRLN